MSLKALRTLVTIARHGTFARAADILSLTPSAVSLHIRSLEEELQVCLFDRSRRQVSLTEAGHLAVERAEGILAAYDEMADALVSGPGLHGRLKIGAIQTALAGRLPAALVRIKAEHPHLHISVLSGMSAELARRVEDGELDAAITTEPVPPTRPTWTLPRCTATASGPLPARHLRAQASGNCWPLSHFYALTSAPGLGASSSRNYASCSYR